MLWSDIRAVAAVLPPMTYRVWEVEDAPVASAWTTTTSDRNRHYPEHSSSVHNQRFPIALGINETTGRVQWCPGCRYVKVMILVPLALTPVVLVLLLFSHLGHAGSLHSANQRDVDTNLIDERQSEAHTENALDARPCTIIRYSMSESVEDDERDLLRDVRTSFIPPDYSYIPPNCRAGDWAEDDETQLEDDDPEHDGGRDEFVDGTGVRKTLDDVYGQRYDNYYYRRRREAETNATVMEDSENSLVPDEISTEKPVSAVLELSARPIEGIDYILNDLCTLCLPSSNVFFLFVN